MSRIHETAHPPRPQLVDPHADDRGLLLWRLDRPLAALSSAAVGGGLRHASWVVNVAVALDYSRTDLAAHADELSDRLGLAGPGITLFTAADIRRWARGHHGDAVVDATVGITKPTWAADPEGGWNDWRPGTINLVAHLPGPLAGGAAVNAVMTMTEAKTQDILEAGIKGTGTASDAVVVLWPGASGEASEEPRRTIQATGTPPEPAGSETIAFCGPRSPLGSDLAIATHDAVTQGIRAFLTEAEADGPSER